MINGKENQRLIVENLTAAVLLFDGRLRLSAANPAAEGLLTTSEKKIRDLEPEAIFPAESHLVSLLRWAMEAGRPFTEQSVQLDRAGSEPITVDCTVTPFSEPKDSDGLLVELVQVDRRSRINREEQLLNQHETIHTMVRGFAHEIRNPLGGLRGAAQLLERELDNPVLEEYTNVIIDEADRLQSLLDRMMGPRTLPEKRMINIHEVTDRVCKLVQSEAPEGVRINCDYDPSIPETSVDSDMLIQALLNIARNAVQAVQRIGHITVRSRIQRQFTIGSRHHRLVVRLDIIDDGPGVPPEMVEKIFYPMVSGRPGGSGLGLSIAQNLIHRHGGIIQCTSRPGETVMTTILPLESSP